MRYLTADRKKTGFAWKEEVLARVDNLVPYNAEQAAKDPGALYRKATPPFVSYVVVDRNLITGQNPGSAKEIARTAAQSLASPTLVAPDLVDSRRVAADVEHCEA